MTLGPRPLNWFDAALVRPGRCWRGHVEQVFRHAAVARVNDGGPLVTLVHPSRPLVPLGMQIPLDACALQPGDPFSLDVAAVGAGRLRFTLDGMGVVLRLDKAAQGSRTALAGQLHALELPPRTAALLGAHDNNQVDFDAALLAVASGELAALARAICGDGALGGAVCRLVGLGPGSTPTGDDLLVGACAAAQRFSGWGWMARERVKDLEERLGSVAAGSTTDVSRQMLGHAASGQFPEALLDFVHALGAEESDGRLRRAAHALEHVGAQTGYDWLAGALAVAHALTPPSRGGVA